MLHQNSWISVFYSECECEMSGQNSSRWRTWKEVSEQVPCRCRRRDGAFLSNRNNSCQIEINWDKSVFLTARTVSCFKQGRQKLIVFYIRNFIKYIDIFYVIKQVSLLWNKNEIEFVLWILIYTLPGRLWYDQKVKFLNNSKIQLFLRYEIRNQKEAFLEFSLFQNKVQVPTTWNSTTGPPAWRRGE